jgi:hypothetical protein
MPVKECSWEFKRIKMRNTLPKNANSEGYKENLGFKMNRSFKEFFYLQDLLLFTSKEKHNASLT